MGPCRAVRRRYGLALEQEIAAIGMDDPHEDIHEGRLARAVMADQPEELAAAELEIDLPQGLDGSEGFAETPQEREGKPNRLPFPLPHQRASLVRYCGSFGCGRSLPFLPARLASISSTVSSRV